jgi:FG-GAP-like repeat
VLVAGLLAACGPGLGSGDGSGSASVGTDGSSSSDDAASHEATGSPDAGGGPNCTRSDLPEPFCHELMVYEKSFGTVIGVLDQVRNGIRPLVVSGGVEFGLRLVNPLNPEEVFAETPAPLEIGWQQPGALSVVDGDFNGDGTTDVAVMGSPPSGDEEFAVLDGATLETLAFRNEVNGFALRLGALDLDGDGIDEIVTGDVDDPGVMVSVWSVEGGGLSLVATELIGVRCEGWSFTRGDYDGDGHLDLAIAWEQWCEEYFRLARLGPPQIVTLLGGSAPSSELGLHYSLQPPSMDEAAAFDFDGDGDTELLIAENVQTMVIVDWVSGGFVEVGSIGVGGYESESFGTLRPGRFTATSPDGVLVGLLLRRADNGSLESFHGALFPSLGGNELVVLPNRVAHIGASDMDLNVDGIVDFHTYVDDGLGVYLSLP